jgi:rhamnulokinase
MASTTQLFDVRAGTWADTLIRAVGDDRARWPRLVSPGTALGRLLPNVAPVATDQPPAVIATCSHDTAAAVAAVPAAGNASWAYISSGTWSLVGAELRSPVLTRQARMMGFTNEVGLDGTIRFLKNRTGMWVLEECVREWSERGEHPTWDTLFAEAAVATRDGPLLDLNAPTLGERGDMLAKLEAACRVAGATMPPTRGALVRLVLESLADSYRATLGELESLTGQRVEVVHIVGGGCRNHLLDQLTADACNRRVVAGPDEATVLGNLLVQARTLGDLPAGVSVRDAARASASLTTFMPQRGGPERTAAPAAHATHS